MYIQKLTKLAACVLLMAGSTMSAYAQGFKDGKIWLNEDGSNYFKFTLVSQVWLRNTDLNPGSTINGFEKNNFTDIGVRRARIQAFGQVADRVFIYSQFGMNNFNYSSDRKAGFFIHDIMGEYEVVRKHLSLGAGLSAWNGLTRFSAPSVGTIMGVDAPLFEQSTNDVTDQFLRKLSIYAKGKLGKLDYRLVMSSPMSPLKAAGYSPLLTSNASFSAKPAKMQVHGYFQWQFLDQEANTTAYTTGTYLGTKSVFNIGAGFQYQPDAMWRAGNNGDTIESNLQHFAVDAYYDAPINPATGTAISAYASYINFNWGKGYLRNQATMNPATGTAKPEILNGSGNGYPSFGTGNLLYGQIGYKFKNNLIGKTTLMPYASLQYAHYERLNDNMAFWDAGVNWLLKGHTSKLTFAYQSRPVYQLNAVSGGADKIDRKGSVLVQFQVFLN
ncbi:hypothetical protein SAMN05428949_5373 [Chitinophaga sp. YR627]|uniref:hypothetical protein n=1 Tax=Chitinophaga sp. YR627 TaxID=1881041 RepID=UPI0008F203D4|nr:hypothetical protein [Chitinophaga sp. YR627]SFO48866.1 hypothetical protein SAMN05428949_5373 [Chitinophaga sp. YR627]